MADHVTHLHVVITTCLTGTSADLHETTMGSGALGQPSP